MTDLKDRLDALADAAVSTISLDDPSCAAPTGAMGSGRRGLPWLAAAAAALVLVVAAVVAVGSSRVDDGEPVTAGPSTTVEPRPAPVLSVVLDPGTGGSTPPLGLTVQVTGPDGDVGPPRSSTEVESPVGGGSDEVFVDRGIIVPLPGAGTYDVAIAGAGPG